MSRPLTQLLPPDLPAGASPQFSTGNLAGSVLTGGHLNSMASLKTLLQLPIKADQRAKDCCAMKGEVCLFVCVWWGQGGKEAESSCISNVKMNKYTHTGWPAIFVFILLAWIHVYKYKAYRFDNSCFDLYHALLMEIGSYFLRQHSNKTTHTAFILQQIDSIRS